MSRSFVQHDVVADLLSSAGAWTSINNRYSASDPQAGHRHVSASVNPTLIVVVPEQDVVTEETDLIPPGVGTDTWISWARKHRGGDTSQMLDV